MRTCSSCNESYEHYGQRCSLCRPCKRVYDREYHKNRTKETKQRKQKLQIERITRNKKFIWEYLSKSSCETCGEDDTVVLEFDYKDQSEKEYTISNMYDSSLEKIKIEIAKCRVLCANCHRRHTAKQLGWYKYLE